MCTSLGKCIYIQSVVSVRYTIVVQNTTRNYYLNLNCYSLNEELTFKLGYARINPGTQALVKRPRPRIKGAGPGRKWLSMRLQMAAIFKLSLLFVLLTITHIRK